jgi:hypothetical protein
MPGRFERISNVFPLGRSRRLLVSAFLAPLVLTACGNEVVTLPLGSEGVPESILSAQDDREPIAPAVPASVQISPKQSSIVVGDSKQLTATVKDESGGVIPNAELAWSSRYPGVAEVDPTGLVTGLKVGTTVIRAAAGDIRANASVTVSAPAGAGAISPGIWIGKAELDELPMSGNAWAADGEVRATADAVWTPQPIERQSRQVFHVQALAGALVYARLTPRPAAKAYRSRVANAIATVISFPVGKGSVTAPARHLGTWAITADLIDLADHDPELDAQFRAWLRHRLDHSYSSNPGSIRESAKQRPNNIGSWARFSLAAASVYLGETSDLDELADIMRFWLGDRTALPVDPFRNVPGGWGAGVGNQAPTWQQNPGNRATWRGIVAAGVTRHGNRFDGIQPEDHWRGNTGAYDPATFPGPKANHRYPEESLEGAVGAVLILYRAGYTDLLDTADKALFRAAYSIRYLAQNYGALGYRYFTGPHEASRPLLDYLYPGEDLPESRTRPQLLGRAKGFAWTYWTHAGRSIP